MQDTRNGLAADSTAERVALWRALHLELDDAQVSAFVYGTQALEKARTINPGLAFLAGPVAFYVNGEA